MLSPGERSTFPQGYAPLQGGREEEDAPPIAGDGDKRPQVAEPALDKKIEAGIVEIGAEPDDFEQGSGVTGRPRHPLTETRMWL